MIVVSFLTGLYIHKLEKPEQLYLSLYSHDPRVIKYSLERRLNPQGFSDEQISMAGTMVNKAFIFVSLYEKEKWINIDELSQKDFLHTLSSRQTVRINKVKDCWSLECMLQNLNEKRDR